MDASVGDTAEPAPGEGSERRCALHPDSPASFTCRRCGSFKCDACAARGTDLCATCVERVRAAWGEPTARGLLAAGFSVLFSTPLLTLGSFGGLIALSLASSEMQKERGLLVWGFGLSVVGAALIEATCMAAWLARERSAPIGLSEALRRAMTRVVPLAVHRLLKGAVIVLGLVFFVVPGLLAYLRWFVSGPAVMDGKGIFGAFERSSDATRDHRGVLLVPGVLPWVGVILALIARGRLTRHPPAWSPHLVALLPVAVAMVGSAASVLLSAMETRAYLQLDAPRG